MSDHEENNTPIKKEENETIEEFNEPVIDDYFIFRDTWTIPEWNAYGPDSPKLEETVKTSTNGVFKVSIYKETERIIRFDIHMLNCTFPYLCSFGFVIVNFSKYRASKKATINFTPESKKHSIKLIAGNQKHRYAFNESYGFTQNNTMLINVEFSKKEYVPPKPRTKHIIEKKPANDQPEEYVDNLPRIRKRINNDSFSLTSEKYCGILNQGSTCYMNSILQAFFHLPIFRRILFQMEVDPNQGGSSIIIYNLRQLFAQMTERNEPVSTKVLTQSFGWKEEEALNHQQDLLEFYGLVLEMMDNKLKGTEMEGEIQNLFVGEIKTHFECLNVPVSRTSKEEFKHISLRVTNCKSLEESLLSFSEPELFVGKNQYKTEEYGFQDAKIWTEFLKFPPILVFQLKRIEYDYQKQRMIRINSRFEFPLSINMSKFLSKDSAQSDLEEDDYSMVYQLFGVLVHAGDAINGHFYAYLHPDPNDDQWFLFNDSSVSYATQQQAINDNFGGKKNEERQNYSAYILIYLKRDVIQQIFCPVSIDMIRDAVNKNNVDQSQIFEEKISLNLYTDAQIEPETLKFIKPISIEVPLTTSSVNFYKIVSKRLCMSNVRIWFFFKNKIYAEVPMVPGYSVSSFITKSFFVEKFNGLRNDYLIFLEFYSPNFKNQKIHFLTSINVSQYYTVSRMIPFIENLVHLEENTPLLAYIQSGPCELTEINIFSSFQNLMLSNGSFIIFQVVPQLDQPDDQSHNFGDNLHSSSSSLFESETKQKYKVIPYFDLFPEETPPMVNDYFYHVNKSRHFYIHDGSNPVFSFSTVFSNNGSEYDYDLLSIPSFLLINKLKQSIIRLQKLPNQAENDLFIYKNNSISPISKSDDPIETILSNNDHIYYSIPHNSFECLRVIFSYEPMKVSEQLFHYNSENQNLYKNFMYVEYFSEDSNIAKLFEYVKSSHKLDENIPLRALQINPKKNSITRILNPTDLLKDLLNPLRVEIIPEDQRKITDQKYLIRCRNIFESNSQKQVIGLPFLLTVNKNEKFSETKQRIRNLINIDEYSWSLTKITLKSAESEEILLYDDIVLSDLVTPNSHINIKHPPKQPQMIGDMEGVKMYN